VQKHFGVIKDYTIVFIACAPGCFSKRKQVN